MTQDLDLSGCLKITDEGLKHLKNVTQILYLDQCEIITDKGLKYLKNVT